MIKFTLFEEGYPDVYIAYDGIGGLADLTRRPSWEEGGLRRVTRIYLTHIPREIIVCEPHERVKELIKLAGPHRTCDHEDCALYEQWSIAWCCKCGAFNYQWPDSIWTLPRYK